VDSTAGFLLGGDDYRGAKRRVTSGTREADLFRVEGRQGNLAKKGGEKE